MFMVGISDELQHIFGAKDMILKAMCRKQCDRCLSVKKKMKKCAGCYAVYYCSRKCQKKKWGMHKLLCQKISKNKKHT